MSAAWVGRIRETAVIRLVVAGFLMERLEETALLRHPAVGERPELARVRIAPLRQRM